MLTTGTTSVTFLLVFRIQNPQHRDGTAAQRKPDELLRAGAGGAPTPLVAAGLCMVGRRGVARAPWRGR